MKIVILDAGTFFFEDEQPWGPLREFGELVIREHTSHDDANLIVERCAGADIVLTNKVPMSADTLKRLPDLKLVGVLATGYNIVDVAAAKELGVTVCNAPSYSTQSVAQHTLALMLELTNHVGLHSESVHAGDWVASEEFCYWKKPLFELKGATVGFIGWGEIGSAVGELVHALGANVIAYTRSRRGGPDWDYGFAWEDLDEVFAQSDLISLHCPQTAENTGLVNRERLALMKDTAYLVNTARGGLIDEAALLEALQNGVIAGAALDVVSKEPMAADNPLKGAPNCIITPHVAWSSFPARSKLLEITFGNIRAFREGEPRNVVS
ncbi:D-2-hydroxyacid dehydrogenase [Cerasicoccus fimbriatus]|uniref:D-2-hydroxyacid dehydrogenase n=1 Tax=Cerasicoccus fimbriatus TaxID=3014554 RepID=UPI0022B5CD77|nr:D-2-hydroxyacid dehydrogenase [Cerasicoccus sp. TK19100]